MNHLQQYIGANFGVKTENVAQVANLFKETEMAAGDYFVQNGQYCNKLSFLHEGFMRVFDTHKGKEITQWVSSQGQFVTDLHSFIFQQRARWNIQALTKCTLYTIEGEAYKNLKRIVPNWTELEKQFISKCFLTLEDRVFKHLSLSAEERYNRLFAENKALFNQVPLHYLASMLGMSPETFSRIRTKRIS